MNTNSGYTHPAVQKLLHFELWHLQERGSPGECCCGCRQGPALYAAPWGPPAPLVSASVAAVSYSTARDSPATVEDWRDGNNMVRKHEGCCYPEDKCVDPTWSRTYSGGGILSGSTSLRNSLPKACSAVQRLLGSRFNMWSNRSRADGGMLDNRSTRIMSIMGLTIHHVCIATPELLLSGTGSIKLYPSHHIIHC